MIPLVPERLQAGRLTYERLGPEHAAPLERLLLDPRVMPTLWPWSRAPTAEDVRSGLDAMTAHWSRHGFGMWALRDRGTGEFVGRGGLQRADAIDAASVEVAWAIVPERWGQGLATEMALKSVEVAFAQLDLAELIALTLPGNLASRRVMEKAGFQSDGEIEHVGLAHVLYRRRAPAG